MFSGLSFEHFLLLQFSDEWKAFDKYKHASISTHVHPTDNKDADQNLFIYMHIRLDLD